MIAPTRRSGRGALARLAACGAALAVGALPVAAQDADSSLAGRPHVPIVKSRDLKIAAGIAGGVAVIAPFDVALTRRLRAPSVQRSPTWRRGAVVFDAYGAPGAMAAGPTLVLAGSLFRNSAATDIGMHVSESYATAALATYLVKGIAGRARPYAVESDRAYDFRLGRGYPHREPYSSFPSGHATGSFAFAAAVTTEASYRWPRHATLVGAVAFGGAFLDGVSRVYRDCHWPSDVAAGAFIGTMSGILVTRYQHSRPDNRLDALGRRVTLAPAPQGGMRIGLTSEF